MESLWEQTCKIEKFNKLQGERRADVVIAGAGIAGILTAHLLKEQGLSVIVLEGRRIGSGQTGRTTAKITFQHDVIYDKLIKKYGKEISQGYYYANKQALENYNRIIREKEIACDFEIKDSYLYADSETKTLENEMKAMEAIGMSGELTSRTRLPFEIGSAIRIGEQAQFHPLKFIKPLAGEQEIYEESLVIRVEDKIVYTDQGKVKAEHIVIASHYPFINIPGYYFMRLRQERSYILALKQGADVDGMYLGIDSGSLSFRNYGSHLLIGGGGHKTGKKKHKSSYGYLYERAKQWYPGSQAAAKWSAQDCMPASHIPYIGRYSRKHSNLYVLTGFQKWGMTSALAGAKMITDKIIKKDNPYAEVFSPQNLRVKGSLGEIAADGGSFLINGTKGIFSSSEKKCTHMGCRLKWNQDEKTWDCPCHGSRYQTDGGIVDNPAIRRLKK